ncbi:ammonium transporter [Ekhidna sp.]|jgi:Amt family ammonium transporter|uniref:ammonium transporter n=1 Tax=Ekhidna sp. TaxID=2608089 RepID=UPI0032ED9A07
MNCQFKKKLPAFLIILLLPMLSFAQDGAVDTGNTAWMLMATALVMLMTPAGLALFYGGLTQHKSVLNTVGMSYVSFLIGTLVWVIIGYSLSFADGNGFIGGLDYVLLKNIGITDIVDGANIPKILDVAFQGTFAAIAVAIVSGSVIERIRFSSWIWFAILWIVVVYAPICHWVWGSEGFLHGDLDFAGGTVIHINAGVSGLVLALLVGRRMNLHEERKPSSIKFMILGSALLWFGWFGFNGGSAYGANAFAANALMVTNVAACSAGVVWLIIEMVIIKKPTLIGVASGAICGLVGITPAAGFVGVPGALVIGIISSIVGYLGVVKLKAYFGHDDTLDAFGMHGLVGIAGALLTGVLANPAIDPSGVGALYGNPGQLLIQLKSVGATIVYSAVGTFVVYKIVALFTKGARITKDLELEGMDIGYHGEQHITIEREMVTDLT